ncbi:MAG: hypothetical protein KDC84_02640 [Crocinitomicaceae bacterium]|nr:hypothetical protein [Crocinitomicaceae bacterium]
MSEIETQQPKKRKDTLYLLIILLLLSGLVAITIMYRMQGDKLNVCNIENKEKEKMMDDMNESFKQYGVMMSDDIRDNLEGMLSQYDAVNVENAEMQDSINAQKDRIKELMVELEDSKKDKKRFIWKIRQLQEETETLRSIMKGYLVTIDSLNTLNVELRDNLDKTQNNLNKMTEDRDLYKETSDKYKNQVQKGSVLSAYGFSTIGLGYNDKENKRAKKVAKVKSCFTIGENTIAQAGKKNIYIRVISPAGKVLTKRNTNTINTNSGTIVYSDSRSIDYQNQAIDVCILADVRELELDKGNYIVEIYADGARIGKDSFALK